MQQRMTKQTTLVVNDSGDVLKECCSFHLTKVID